MSSRLQRCERVADTSAIQCGQTDESNAGCANEEGMERGELGGLHKCEDEEARTISGLENQREWESNDRLNRET